MNTAHAHPDQLSLFAPPSMPERFRIDEATRRRGMRHVAELKARLEARYPSPRPHSAPDGGRVPLGARAGGRAA